MEATVDPIDRYAVLWLSNGDHPLDGPADREGRVVRYFRRPDVPGDQACGHCGRVMRDHGWIDVEERGRTVCPGDWIFTDPRSGYYPVKPDLFPVLARALYGQF